MSYAFVILLLQLVSQKPSSNGKLNIEKYEMHLNYNDKVLTKIRSLIEMKNKPEASAQMIEEIYRNENKHSSLVHSSLFPSPKYSK